MKMYCVSCGLKEELSSDELKEASEFVLKNNLEAIDYLNYITLKRGKTCNNKKKHTFLFDTEWQEQLIKLTREIEAFSEKHISNGKLIEDLKGRLKELEHQMEIKVAENVDLEIKESNVLGKIIETTGNNKLELWK